METTDIVIHKGEKEEKYHLYVEDYVMSYLKNYGSVDGRNIFFYGTREKRNNKYYIYGAGRGKNISYFVRYELLDEIVCRYDMDEPVFSVKEDSGRYELAGYYIFYQSNEAMQSYMIEQKKAPEYPNQKKESGNAMAHFKSRPQDFADIRTRAGINNAIKGGAERGRERGIERGAERGRKSGRDGVIESIKSVTENKSGEQQNTAGSNQAQMRTNVRMKKKTPAKSGGSIMAFQLSAVFLIMAAIIINSTNSYTKLRDLGQSAVEVFFTMENQEAADNTVAEPSKGTLLKLEDLDSEFEKENQTAKEEENTEDGDIKETGEDKEDGDNNISEEEAGIGENGTGLEGVNAESGNGTGLEGANAENGKGTGLEGANAENGKGTGLDEVNAEGGKDTGLEGANAENENGRDLKESSGNGKNNDGLDKEKEETSVTDEASAAQSKEAFARNFANYYQIEKGDTLCNISIKIYGDASKVKEICEINKIDNPDNIKYGQKILLP